MTQCLFDVSAVLRGLGGRDPMYGHAVLILSPWRNTGSIITHSTFKPRHDHSACRSAPALLQQVGLLTPPNLAYLSKRDFRRRARWCPSSARSNASVASPMR